MRNTVRMLVVLTVVGLISGATLVFMYQYAAPLIVKNQNNEMEQAVFDIFPEAKDYDKKGSGENIFFEVKDKSGELLGYAFIAEGNGYQGTIKMMAGIKKDLITMVGIDILESQETPGLGAEIDSKGFKAQFKGLMTSPKIDLVKNLKAPEPAGTQAVTGASPPRGNKVEAITGATISSRAVCTILNEKIKVIKGYIK